MKTNMKTMNRILLGATVTMVLGSLNYALAQAQMSGPNGLAASPKVRQMLSERPAKSAEAAPTAAASQTSNQSAAMLAGSPKARQMAQDNAKSTVADTTSGVVASTQGKADAIAASPKVRAQMDERPVQFQIAPLK